MLELAFLLLDIIVQIRKISNRELISKKLCYLQLDKRLGRNAIKIHYLDWNRNSPCGLIRSFSFFFHSYHHKKVYSDDPT